MGKPVPMAGEIVPKDQPSYTVMWSLGVLKRICPYSAGEIHGFFWGERSAAFTNVEKIIPVILGGLGSGDWHFYLSMLLTLVLLDALIHNSPHDVGHAGHPATLLYFWRCVEPSSREKGVRLVFDISPRSWTWPNLRIYFHHLSFSLILVLQDKSTRSNQANPLNINNQHNVHCTNDCPKSENSQEGLSTTSAMWKTNLGKAPEFPSSMLNISTFH